ncbi:MAG: site-specific integrase [Mycobacterium leprae]
MAKARGEWVDPTLSEVTVGEWARHWYDTQVHLKPSTHATYGIPLRRQVLPRWQQVPLSRVMHADVVAWIAAVRATGLSASRTRAAHRVLSRILDLAVRDGRLPKNPAVGVDLPRLPKAERRYLTHGQLVALADACGSYRTLVLVLGYSGLRWGEAVALRVRNVDPMRRRIDVVESVTDVGGRPVFGTPKTHASRTIPIQRFLRVALADACVGKGPDDLVFTAPEGECSELTTSDAGAGTEPRRWSASTGWYRTSCATLPHLWRSQPEQRSRLYKRCLDTPRRP